MFELAGARFEKGEFEVRLEKVLPAWKAFFAKLGPIRGRVIALIFIVFGGVLTFSRQPGTLVSDRGWVDSAEAALRVQNFTTWGVVGLGLFIYVLVLAFRREKMILDFDRTKKEFRYFKEPFWAAQRPEEGLFRFADLKDFEVVSAAKAPSEPFGYVRLLFKSDMAKAEKEFKFRFLTDEQFKIYPTNLARILERNPKGDWVDPDA